MTDEVDEKLARLSEGTRDLPLPPGFEARVFARLQARTRESFWEVCWAACRNAFPVALVAAALLLSIAAWQDAELTDALSRTPDGAVVDQEIRDP